MPSVIVRVCKFRNGTNACCRTDAHQRMGLNSISEKCAHLLLTYAIYPKSEEPEPVAFTIDASDGYPSAVASE